jgi:exodeoxyribonuclease VII large subunit
MCWSGRCGCRATSGAEVAAAVNGFNELSELGAIRRPDLLIVARGGGSLEDLWGFNDEGLVRAVAASHIPVISAVGHETDWTLIDLAADRRAPTPTGAAELAVPVKAELEAVLANLGARLRGAVSRMIDRRSQAVRAAARALPTPDQLLALPRRRFDEATSRLGRALTVTTERKRARLSAVRLSPATLARRISETRRHLDRDMLRADAALRAMVREKRIRFDRTKGRLSPEPLVRRQEAFGQQLTALERRAVLAVGRRLERARTSLSQADRLMATLSHKAVLARGFALVRDADGTVLKRASEVAAGAALSIEFADGTTNAIATSGSAIAASGEAKPKPVARPAAKVKEPGNQGSLF